jgi:hypothetical protein
LKTPRQEGDVPDDKVDDVEPDGSVRNPPDLLQASNETTEHANYHDNNHHGHKAKPAFSNLFNIQRLAKDQDRHRQELLE